MTLPIALVELLASFDVKYMEEKKSCLDKRALILSVFFRNSFVMSFILTRMYVIRTLQMPNANASNARDDPHSKCIKCLGFSHAREAVYGISKCKFCENLCLITLHSRLEACE